MSVFTHARVQLFTSEERCQSSGQPSCRCSRIICSATVGIHLQCSKHYFTFAKTTDRDRFFPRMPPSISGFSDRLVPSHPYTVACFPIKPVKLPLLLLPGPRPAVRMCVYVCWRLWPCVDCVCVCLWLFCLYTCFYGRISKGLQRQPPSITNSKGKWRKGWRMEREMEVSTGSSIW